MDTKQNIDKKSVIINLQKSSNAKSYKPENLIHQREFERATKLIDERIKKSETEDKIRFNDTISILGSRGSGKTSFLLSLLAHYKDSNDVEVLEIIDPTLIEEKGHIFLTVISLIEESVCKKLNLSDCSPNDSSYHLKKEWKDKLRKLADGLPSMDGVGSSLEHSDWQDAEFIMDRGLKSVKAATDLEANFNELVKFALKILGQEKKAIIITLDDIDVDFRKGWPVMETLRKYMTSTQIIVLLSGDLKLYSKAIRKQQWGNFGKALLKNEAEALDKMDSYNDLVTEMEGQYMQKVLKPENRIHLTTVHEKIEFLDEKIFIGGSINPEIEIKIFYNKLLALCGIRNQYQAEAYTSFLLNLSIRTQIQFLSGLENLDVSDTTNITDPFLSDLYEKEVDVDLAKYLPKMLPILILKLLIKEQVLSEAYQLQPLTIDKSLNGSLTALSFLFSQKVKKNPYLIFDYMIKIGYVRNLLTNIGYAEKDDKKGTSLLKPSIEGLCHHSGVFQDKVLRDIVGSMIAYIESCPNSNENQIGSIYLYAKADKNKKSKKEAEGRIDYVFGGKNATNYEQSLAFMPVSISEQITKNSSVITFSIYSLIGTIGELLRKIDLKDLEKGLLELSQLRTYPMVSFDRGLVNPSDNENYDETTEDVDTTKYSILIKYLEDWRNNFSEIICSPHFIGKISTRMYYTLNTIKNKKDCNINLGVAMHRRIIALMNAILIEDIQENYSNTLGLNISNAVTSDKLLIDNLNFANNPNCSTLSFSRWMLSCPLFLLYLDPIFLQEKVFINFILGEDNSETYDFHKNTIYEKLIKVELKEQNVTKSQKISSLPKFSAADNNIKGTIDILKKAKMSGDKLFEISFDEFKEIYSTLFSGTIKPKSFETLKAKIRNKKVKWELAQS